MSIINANISNLNNMNLLEKEFTMIYEAPAQPNPFNYRQIKFKGLNDKDISLKEILTNATPITYAFIIFNISKDDAATKSILEMPECLAKKQNVVIITIEASDVPLEPTYKAVNKTDISAPEVINPSDLKLVLENEVVIAKATLADTKQYLDVQVKYNDVIKSKFYKIFSLIPLLDCFINAKYVTIVEERTTLDKEYFTNIEKYMDSHPNCAICYPHVAANAKCSLSSVYQISNIFYSNYHQIESYSIESVMGSIIHPRYGTFTISKQQLMHMGVNNSQISNFSQLISQNDLVNANLWLFTNGIKNTKYSYSYYNLNAIAYKEYPNTFEGFAEEQSQYYSDHTNSFLSTYSKRLYVYKSNAPVGIKVYYTFYLLFGFIPKIIDIIMPSLIVVLYSILFSDFFTSKAGVVNGCTISTLAYFMAIAISTTQRAQRNSKWILLISLVTIGVLNSIMVGLYIKYTFVKAAKKKVISISAFSLLICSYPIISAIGFKRIKSNIVSYSIGLALHAFVFPFHLVFMNVQSYLKTLYVPYPQDKAHVEKASEIKSIVTSIIIFLNIAIFCIFKPIDSGEVHKSMSILIQILSYYFIITCSIKVIFTIVFQIMYVVGMRKKPALAKEKDKIEPGKSSEINNEKKEEKNKEEAKKDQPPEIVVVNVEKEKSPSKTKSPKKVAK